MKKLLGLVLFVLLLTAVPFAVAEEAEAVPEPAPETETALVPPANEPADAETYTITWLDDDETVLAVTQVAAGVTPVYPNGTPTKEKDADYVYTFMGWDPEPEPATEDTSYTAMYSAVVRQDKCGPTLYWSFDAETGTLAITGSGKMNSYQYESDVPWHYLRHSIRILELPDGLANIPAFAFQNCWYITSITIPETVTYIDKDAFEFCYGLTNVTLQVGITSIAPRAFKGCSRLISISIPAGVTTIGPSAFENCSSLASIELPDSLQYVNLNAFSNTAYLKALPDGLIYQDGVLLGYKNLYPTTISVKKGTYLIADSAFYGCDALIKLTIPESVGRIGSNAFYGCSGIVSLTMPCSIAVEENSFDNCSGMTSVHLTKGTGVMTDWRNGATGQPWFYSGSNELSIVLDDGITHIGGGTFSRLSGLKSVTLPDSVTSIGYEAFWHCTGLTEITLPCIDHVGDGSFEGTSNITTVHLTKGTGVMSCASRVWQYSNPSVILLDEGITNIVGIGGQYSTCSRLAEIVLPSTVTTIGDQAFMNCSGLSSVTILGDVISIGKQAFSGCTSLQTIALPDSMESIGTLAFSGCTALSDITLPCSVTFGYWPFENCTGLTSIHVTEGTGIMPNYDSYSPWQSIRGNCSVTLDEGIQNLGNNLFQNCSWLQSVTIPQSLTSIGNSAFYGCTGLTELVIPDHVASIGTYAFAQCSGLTSVVLPDSITELKEHAFHQCENIASIHIPNQLETIGESAFYGCGITELIIPESVKRINDAAFSGCVKLESLTIPCSVFCGTENSWWPVSPFAGCSAIKTIRYTKGTGEWNVGNLTWDSTMEDFVVVLDEGIRTIAARAFQGCSGIKSVSIPGSVTLIGQWAFNQCSALSTVTIGNGNTVIDNSAFNRCESLESVWIGSGENTIMSSAFYNCPALKTVTIGSGKKTIKNSAFASSAVTDVYYLGTKAMRNRDVTIENGNNPLTDAAWHYLNLTGIALTTPPSKTVYGYGEAFDPTGAVLTATYEQGITETLALTADMVTGYNPNKAGEQTLTVNYEGKTTTFRVTVNALAPSDVMSTAANFMGKMLVNYYIVMSEEALADKDAYVEIKLNDDVKKVLVRDADTDEKNGVLRHKFEMEVPSKCMRDDIVLKLHAGNGSLLPLTYKQEQDVTEGFVYHMVDYLRGRQQNSTSETMRRLAYTAEWYGTACQLYFNHHVNQLTEAEIAAMNEALNDASIMTGLANYAPIEGGTLPNGITKRSNTVVFESDNTLRTYFYTANPNAYTFTMDDNEIHLNEWEAGKYNYDIPNIPGKELAKWHKVTATDGTNTYTYKTSALGYCYGRAANSSNADMQNLAKTLYLYGKAAMAYFGVPDQPAPADTPAVPDAPAEPVLPESLQGRDIQLPIVP